MDSDYVTTAGDIHEWATLKVEVTPGEWMLLSELIADYLKLREKPRPSTVAPCAN